MADIVEAVLRSWDKQDIRRTGASRSDLARLENTYGRLPEAFWRLWAASDGTGYDDDEMFHFWPVEEILENKKADPETQAKFCFCDFMISSHLYGFGKHYPHTDEIYLLPGWPRAATWQAEHPPQFIALDFVTFLQLYLDKSHSIYGA